MHNIKKASSSFRTSLSSKLTKLKGFKSSETIRDSDEEDEKDAKEEPVEDDEEDDEDDEEDDEEDDDEDDENDDKEAEETSRLVKSSVLVKPALPHSLISKSKTLPTPIKPLSVGLNGVSTKRRKLNGLDLQIGASRETQGVEKVEEDKEKDSETDENRVVRKAGKELVGDESSDSSQNGSESETDSGSETSSGSEDEGESSDDNVSQTNRTISKPAAKKATTLEPAPPYEPPEGFDPATITISPSCNLTELFSPASLRSKEVWHITVPSSISISKLKEVSLHSVHTGTSIISHEGADFGLTSEATRSDSNMQILLPSAEHNIYKPTKVEIAKTFHLRQIISSPKISSSIIPHGFRNVPSSYEKPPRPQPDGLRMRYHPFGATEDPPTNSESDLSSEKPAQIPTFRPPIGVETPRTVKKRRNQKKSDIQAHHGTKTFVEIQKKKGQVESGGTVFTPTVERNHLGSIKTLEKMNGNTVPDQGVMETPMKKQKKSKSTKSIVATEPLSVGIASVSALEHSSQVQEITQQAITPTPIKGRNPATTKAVSPINPKLHNLEGPSSRKRKAHASAESSNVETPAKKRKSKSNAEPLQPNFQRKVPATPSLPVSVADPTTPQLPKNGDAHLVTTPSTSRKDRKRQKNPLDNSRDGSAGPEVAGRAEARGMRENILGRGAGGKKNGGNGGKDGVEMIENEDAGEKVVARARRKARKEKRLLKGVMGKVWEGV